jgi:hypothetical protein
MSTTKAVHCRASLVLLGLLCGTQAEAKDDGPEPAVEVEGEDEDDQAGEGENEENEEEDLRVRAEYLIR